MMVDVFLRDGRTTLRFRSRKQLYFALTGDLDTIDDVQGVLCWKRFEGFDASAPGKGKAPIVATAWVEHRCLHLSRSSISSIAVVPAEPRQKFELLFPKAIDKPAPAAAEETPA